MIIWGSRALKKTLSRGRFYCPDEGAERDYELISARRWFALFFIPLIPLNELGTYIECSGCGQKYNESVLQLPTPESQEKTYAAGLRAAVATVLRDSEGSVASDRQRQAAVEAVGGYLGPDSYGQADLAGDLVMSTADANSALSELGAMLNAYGQEQVLRTCLNIVSTEDDHSRRGLVAELGQAMGMRPAHTQGIISEDTPTPPI